MVKVGIYPGSFSPWHRGHTDVLHKALLVFDEVIVAVGRTPDKSDIDHYPMIEIDEKLKDKVKTSTYHGLLVDEVQRLQNRGINLTGIIRGLRNGHDLQYEQNMQYWNEDLGITIPTVYFITDRTLGHISSSSIRNIDTMKEISE